MINFDQTIISQYASAPTLNRLIYNFNQYIDPAANIDLFYNNIWNIDTAVGKGLIIWGEIVGVSNVVQIPNSPLYFGFEGALPYGSVGFDQGPFYNGEASIAGAYDLDDDEYRTLILAKALANISDGSIPAQNQILLNLFPGRGNCYVTDGQDMTMQYVFNFTLTQVEYAIVTQSGVLPKPAGVSANFVVN
jgi:hypothetical protein